MHIPDFQEETLQYTLNDDETVEDLQLNGMHLIQKKKSFRFGMDSVLLAHFAEIRPTDTVADLGTGNGILPLLLHGRKKGKKFFAIDIQKEAAELAERNAVINSLEDVIAVIHSDVKKADEFIKPCTIDAAVCNPPYGHPDASLVSPRKEKAIARSQNEDTLDHLFSGAFRLLKGRGKLFLVYPAPQMLYIMKILQLHHLEPKRFQLVYPYADKPANLVLIEAVKDAKPMLHPFPPLIIYNPDGTLTNELKSVYHII